VPRGQPNVSVRTTKALWSAGFPTYFHGFFDTPRDFHVITANDNAWKYFGLKACSSCRLSFKQLLCSDVLPRHCWRKVPTNQGHVTLSSLRTNAPLGLCLCLAHGSALLPIWLGRPRARGSHHANIRYHGRSKVYPLFGGFARTLQRPFRESWLALAPRARSWLPLAPRVRWIPFRYRGLARRISSGGAGAFSAIASA
jgi:hypothetical protein